MPRIDLNVPYHEKDEARRLGARWDAKKKVWFLPDGADASALRRWIPETLEINLRSGRYFILKTERICWKCGASTAVYAFGLPVGHETLEVYDDDGDGPGTWEKAEMSAVPSYITFLTEEPRRRIQGMTPCYRLDFSQTTKSCYWMNHCEHCGMKQGDFELFSEPDEAFLPFSAARAAAIRVEEFREPFGAWAGEFAVDVEFLPE